MILFHIFLKINQISKNPVVNPLSIPPPLPFSGKDPTVLHNENAGSMPKITRNYSS